MEFLVEHRTRDSNRLIVSDLTSHEERWEAIISGYNHLKQAFNTRSQSRSKQAYDNYNAKYCETIYTTLTTVKGFTGRIQENLLRPAGEKKVSDRVFEARVREGQSPLNLALWLGKKIFHKELATKEQHLQTSS